MLVYKGIFRHIQTQSGVFRNYSEIFRHIQKYVQPWYIWNLVKWRTRAIFTSIFKALLYSEHLYIDAFLMSDETALTLSKHFFVCWYLILRLFHAHYKCYIQQNKNLMRLRELKNYVLMVRKNRQKLVQYGPTKK